VGTTSVSAGDVNNDGLPDLVTANPFPGVVNNEAQDFRGHGHGADELAVALGGGDGTFRRRQPLPAGSSPIAVLTGDFNRDGRLDLATANYASSDVTVSLGLGDGTFADASHFATGVRPVALVQGDFNGDGRTDLGVVNAGSDDVSLLLGR